MAYVDDLRSSSDAHEARVKHPRLYTLTLNDLTDSEKDDVKTWGLASSSRRLRVIIEDGTTTFQYAANGANLDDLGDLPISASRESLRRVGSSTRLCSCATPGERCTSEDRGELIKSVLAGWGDVG